MLGKTNWSRWSGLNRRPTVYETVALPLSYTGLGAGTFRLGAYPSPGDLPECDVRLRQRRNGTRNWMNTGTNPSVKPMTVEGSEGSEVRGLTQRRGDAEALREKPVGTFQVWP